MPSRRAIAANPSAAVPAFRSLLYQIAFTRDQQQKRECQGVAFLRQRTARLLNHPVSPVAPVCDALQFGMRIPIGRYCSVLLGGPDQIFNKRAVAISVLAPTQRDVTAI
jgi:hypothetical protein